MFDIILDDDFVTLVGLTAVLLVVGSNMATEPAVRLWGKWSGGVGYLAFTIRAAMVLKPADAATLLHIAFRGLFAALLTVGLFWIVVSVVVFVIQCLFFLHRRRRTQHQTLAFKQDERIRLAQDEEALRRATQEAERDQQNAVAAAEARRRRGAARASCQVLYDLFAPEIGTRFPREQFDKLVEAHLNDNYPPDYVEFQAAQLQDLIRQHLEKATLPKSPNLEDVCRWYAAERQRIEAVPDDALRKTLQVKLKTRFSDLADQLLEDSTP